MSSLSEVLKAWLVCDSHLLEALQQVGAATVSYQAVLFSIQRQSNNFAHVFLLEKCDICAPGGLVVANYYSEIKMIIIDNTYSAYYVSVT